MKIVGNFDDDPVNERNMDGIIPVIEGLKGFKKRNNDYDTRKGKAFYNQRRYQTDQHIRSEDQWKPDVPYGCYSNLEDVKEIVG